MKKIFFILLTMILIAVHASAAITADKLTAEPVTFVLEEDDVQFIELYLSGNTLYTAHSMEIYLPDELEFARDEDGDLLTLIDDLSIYPSKRGYPSSHSLSSVYHANRHMVAVACISVASEEFKSTSGRLLYVGIRPKATAKPCEVKVDVRNIHLIDKKAMDYTAEDMQVTVIVASPKPKPTAVGCVELKTPETISTEYTISGQKASLSAKGKGIYIRRGKKYVR